MTRSQKVLAGWKALPLWERAAWCVVVLCLLGALGLRYGVRAANPELAVAVAYARDPLPMMRNMGGQVVGMANLAREHLDPWGNPFQARGLSRPSNPNLLDVTAWSFGPNGVNEDRGGDDIVVGVSPYSTALIVSRDLLLLLALLLAWCLCAPFRGSPRAPLRTELWRAAVLALPPALLGLWVLYFGGIARNLPASRLLVVPTHVAVAATLVLLCFLLALAARLRPAS